MERTNFVKVKKSSYECVILVIVVYLCSNVCLDGEVCCLIAPCWRWSEKVSGAGLTTVMLITITTSFM